MLLAARLNRILFVLSVVEATFTFALPTSTFLQRRSITDLSSLPPSQDPFYKLPDNLSSFPLGHIIRSRKLPSVVSIFGSDAGDAYQLFYRTNSVLMLPDATVTTVIAPKVPAQGVAKIVAIASPEDSAALDCSISWALYPQTQSKQSVGGVQPTRLQAMAALFNGYYVTIPDQEGSKSAWLAYSEGYTMLDGIRAIVNHRDTIQNKEGYNAVLTGYSGGGHGAAWGAQLASTYGQEIPIVALAAGGVPVNLQASLEYLDDTKGSGLVFTGIAGLANAYPKLDQYISTIMKPNGTDAIKLVRSGSVCISQEGAALANKSFTDSTVLEKPFNNSVAQAAFEANFLGKHQKAIKKFPVYLTHSRVDETVIFGPLLKYYHSQCSQGGHLILTAPDSGTHAMTAIKSIPSFFNFINRAFQGNLNVSKCRITPKFLIPFDGFEAERAVGKNVVDQLKYISAISP